MQASNKEKVVILINNKKNMITVNPYMFQYFQRYRLFLPIKFTKFCRLGLIDSQMCFAERTHCRRGLRLAIYIMRRYYLAYCRSLSVTVLQRDRSYTCSPRVCLIPLSLFLCGLSDNF